MPLNLGNGLILLVEVKKSTFFFYSCLEERDTFINICLVCNLVSQCFTSQLKTQLFSTNKRKIKFDVVCFLWSLSCSALKEPPNGETCNFKTKAFLIEYGWVLGTKGITGRAILFFAGIILRIRRSWLTIRFLWQKMWSLLFEIRNSLVVLNILIIFLLTINDFLLLGSSVFKGFRS